MVGEVFQREIAAVGLAEGDDLLRIASTVERVAAAGDDVAQCAGQVRVPKDLTFTRRPTGGPGRSPGIVTRYAAPAE